MKCIVAITALCIVAGIFPVVLDASEADKRVVWAYPRHSTTPIDKISSHQAHSINVESLLVKALLDITQGNTERALISIESVLHQAPNFKLAHLIRGDLLLARANRLQNFGGMSSQDVSIRDFREEAKARISHYLANSLHNKRPELWVEPNGNQPYVMVLDTNRARLLLYQHRADKLVYMSDYYVTVGKNGIDKQSNGDKRTPLGVYFIGKKFNKRLADLYGGIGYPLNYPNEWDVLNHRQGSGIWLHGTPHDSYSRPPHSSDGCVVLGTTDLQKLAGVLRAGNIPIIISNKLRWVDGDRFTESELTDKQSLKKAMSHWLNDWRSQNTPAYLSHYSSHFRSGDYDIRRWSAYKTKIQSSKPRVTISLSHLSYFGYPSANNQLVMVNFTQVFKSASLQDTVKKRQYWIKENQAWKIIYEGVI